AAGHERQRARRGRAHRRCADRAGGVGLLRGRTDGGVSPGAPGRRRGARRCRAPRTRRRRCRGRPAAGRPHRAVAAGCRAGAGGGLMAAAAPSRGLIWTAAAVVVAIVTVAGARAAKSALANVADAPVSIPTARVTRGALEPTVYMRGDVRAARQHAITAPPVGGALRILEMAGSGEQATAGGIVLRFDPADQEYAL